MRREILLATVAVSAFALLAACENKNNNQSPAPSPSAQSEGQSGAPAKAKRTARAERRATPGTEYEVSDIAFAKNAAIGDMYEISASRLALDRSNSPSVQRYARDMIDAHIKTTTGLKGTLPPSTVQMLPADLDVEHQSMIHELRDANNADFDHLYLAQQREAHEQALALFRSYADYGNDARLQQFAQDTLPAIERHIDRVASLTATKKVAAASNKSRKD